MTAIDAAVLAGARALQNSGGDAEAAMAVARRIYSQATQKRSDHVRDAIGFEAADGNTAMIARGPASIATSVLKVIGIKDLALLEATEYARAVLPLGANARQHIEVALVVDASGAVSEDTFDSLRDAAKVFGELLLWAEQTHCSVRLALVPFASGVRPGDDVWPRIAPDLPSASWCVSMTTDGCAGLRASARLSALEIQPCRMPRPTTRGSWPSFMPRPRRVPRPDGFSRSPPTRGSWLPRWTIRSRAASAPDTSELPGVGTCYRQTGPVYGRPPPSRNPIVRSTVSPTTKRVCEKSWCWLQAPASTRSIVATPPRSSAWRFRIGLALPRHQRRRAAARRTVHRRVRPHGFAPT